MTTVSLGEPTNDDGVHIMDEPADSGASDERPVICESQSNDTVDSVPLVSWRDTKKRRLNQDSVAFSTRISVALTVCSLFILLDHPDPSMRRYYDATWIYIVCCIVLWLPAPEHPLDSTSVVLQMGSMLLGSIVGAALAILCGSLVSLIDDDVMRAFFMGCCIAVVTFFYCFLNVYYNILEGLSACLGLFLFAISLFPFLDDRAWSDALFRVFNAWLGCLIACVSSLVVFPRSTTYSLQRQVHDQVDLAGDCVQLILKKASRVFSGDQTTRNLTSLMEETRRDSRDPDEAHAAYATFLKDSYSCSSLLSMLKYDFMGKWCQKKNNLDFECILQQAFVVVSAVVILDSCIRQEGVHVDQDVLAVINRVGELVKILLSTNLSEETVDKSVDGLFAELGPIHEFAVEAAHPKSSVQPRQSLDLQVVRDALSSADGRMPLSVGEGQGELFFLELVEQLVLQSLGLHYAWIKQNDTTCLRAGQEKVVTSAGNEQKSENIAPEANAETVHKEDAITNSPLRTANDEASPTKEVDEVGNIESDDASTYSVEEKNMSGSDSMNESCEEVKLKRGWKYWFDQESVQFGIRTSVTMTLSSLFILLDSPDPSQRTYPEGAWVLVSAAVVCWYPSLDAASVVLKTFERIAGTCVAAILGWTCGLLATLIQEDEWRSVFLGICIAVVTFVYSFLGFRSQVYNSHQYGSFVGIFTYGNVLFPFTGGDINAWQTGLYRIINVIIGCLIACFAALLIFPKSTKCLIRKRVTEQVAMAGRFGRTVLTRRQDLSDKDREDAYKIAVTEYKLSKDLFLIQSADPFVKKRDRKRGSPFRQEAAMTLARCFRLETSVIFLDRNITDIPQLFASLGISIEAMLKGTEDTGASATASEDVLQELAELQPMLTEARARVSQADNQLDIPAVREALSRVSRRVPATIEGEDCNELSCLLLAEHLALRSLRLYYTWRQNRHCTALY